MWEFPENMGTPKSTSSWDFHKPSSELVVPRFWGFPMCPSPTWEGYKRTQGMMCAASSRSLAAQLAAPAAAAAGVAVAEPAGSLLPQNR